MPVRCVLAPRRNPKTRRLPARATCLPLQKKRRYYQQSNIDIDRQRAYFAKYAKNLKEWGADPPEAGRQTG